jgi:hypothetical protein
MTTDAIIIFPKLFTLYYSGGDILSVISFRQLPNGI